MLSRQKLLLAMALATLIGSANADPLVYVVSAGLTGSGRFGTVDLTTGAFQQVGPVEPDGYFGLAPGPNGSLLSFTYASNLDRINTSTGVPTRIGATGLPGCVVPTPSCGPTTAFTLGGFEGRTYGVDISNSVYTVNPITGAATLLAKNSGLPTASFVPGTQNPNGTANFADEAIWESGGKLYLTYDALTFDLKSFTVASVVVAPELYQIELLNRLPSCSLLGIGAALELNGALALMSESVSWPKASEGGRVVGKEEIRAYWSRQWKEFDPQVEPLEVIDRGAGKTDVRVHQLVKSLSGDVLSDSEIRHAYTIANGLIERMDLGESEANSEQSRSSAFSRH